MLRFSRSKMMKINGPVVGGARGGGILPELTSNHSKNTTENPATRSPERFTLFFCKFEVN